MATASGNASIKDDDGLPKSVVTSPTFSSQENSKTASENKHVSLQDGSEFSSMPHHLPPHQLPQHVRLEELSGRKSESRSSSAHVRLEDHHDYGAGSRSSSIYMGSYGHRRSRSRASAKHSVKSTGDDQPPSSGASISQLHLDHLVRDVDLGLKTYGVDEFRDGFFDGIFFKPSRIDDQEELLRMAKYTLPLALKKHHPLSIRYFLPKQLHEIKGVILRVCTTRAGIKLSKTFLAFFVSYVLCLIPAVSRWLGPYDYIVCLSAILNHPGRTVGAQLDGAVLTILGTATGLGWGAFALWLSNSSSVAADGYGGILAAFMAVFIGTTAALRSYFIRCYQLVIPAGIAVIFTLQADTSRSVDWRKLLDYEVPWLIGQAICLLVACSVFPDAGARPLAVAIHDAFAVMQDGLHIPRTDTIEVRRQLALTFVNISQAYRDLVLDISITRFDPPDVKDLRNLLQDVIRSFISLKTVTDLFDDNGDAHVAGDVVISIDSPTRPSLSKLPDETAVVELVKRRMADPVSTLLHWMQHALTRSDAVLLDMSGYRKYLGPPADVSSDIVESLTSLRKAMIKFDEEDEALQHDPRFPATSFSQYLSVVDLYLFMNPVRQAATAVEKMVVKINTMQQKHSGWTFHLPSYSLAKSLRRTNAQVRHDRGGITAGHFFQSQKLLKQMITDMQENAYAPLRSHDELTKEKSSGSGTSYKRDEDVVLDRRYANKSQFRYKIWRVLHRLQGFETRFALKVVIVTVLLSVPAWLPQSAAWYNRYQSWWAVAMAWLMMHPRVGGNFQDLVTRSLCAVIGAVWGGLAYRADHGNSYVMAVFAAIFMLPMLYRYTQSTHPRSGLIGCISFTVVSLNVRQLQAEGERVITVAWTHGVAFVVGVVSAIVVNWILWPFVARHELRKSIATMIYHSAIIYRGVVAKYIYYQAGEEPSNEDLARSELLEGRLREGFVRLRQLMDLTRHEIRLRGPFDPLPYSALIMACESFFENLVAVRQSSLFFHPSYVSGDSFASEDLLPYRRDAVASILMTLSTLAGALKGNRKVPRYLPSAAAARKRLLTRMAELETEHTIAEGDLMPREHVGRRFAEVYRYAYSQGLTNCVEQLEQLVKYTKSICGEEGFDLLDYHDMDDNTRKRSTIHGLLDGH